MSILAVIQTAHVPHRLRSVTARANLMDTHNIKCGGKIMTNDE